MKKILTVLLALALSGLLSACVSESDSELPPTNEKAITANTTGTDGGYFYSYWTNGNGSVTMYLDGATGFRASWTDCGIFTCGKGWAVGTGRTVEYAGYFNTSGGGFFGMYGWMVNPLIEYYVVETWGAGTNPATSGTKVGEFESDGSVYDVYRGKQIDQPSIQGTATFLQYKSFRRTPRTSGTITMQNHFDGWKKLGLELGARQHYQILLTEGNNGSGSGGGTIKEAGK
jgi:endo-1,4-beta-xylanase